MQEWWKTEKQLDIEVAPLIITIGEISSDESEKENFYNSSEYCHSFYHLFNYQQASWVASTYSLGMIPGSIICGPLTNRIGHRYTLLLSHLHFLIGWIIIALSNSFPMLIAGRMVSGLGGGFQITVTQLYIAEISDNNIRGRLMVLSTVSALVGTLLALTIGPFVSFAIFAIICGSITLLLSIGTLLMAPQTPYFLVRRGDEAGARKVLAYLFDSGQSSTEIDVTMNEIKDTISYQSRNKFTLMKLLTDQYYRKPLLLIMAGKTINEFCGTYVLNTYVQTIITLSNSSLTPSVGSVIFGAIQIPSSKITLRLYVCFNIQVVVILSALLIDKIGRNPVTIISSVGAGIPFILEGVYFYLQDVWKINLDNFNFFPILGLSVYRIMISFGISSLPYILVAELLSVNAKEVGSLTFGVYCSILMFTSVKIFNPIMEVAGLYTLFWIFASFCLLGVLFGMFMPETKGKSFNAIQDQLQSIRQEQPQEEKNERYDQDVVGNGEECLRREESMFHDDCRKNYRYAVRWWSGAFLVYNEGTKGPPPYRWQETEDFGKKKEIRSHMYKLREERLRDFYSKNDSGTDIHISQTKSTPNDTIMKDGNGPNHAQSLIDHSFLSMKSKEIRDSESPTSDIHHFRSAGK
ncbi:hypothetical protein FQA39_LY14594 [Lamprigera yunnana]|nr:hypothetical protein FQA39_LY14594 [Lamprigera yunnana]